MLIKHITRNTVGSKTVSTKWFTPSNVLDQGTAVAVVVDVAHPVLRSFTKSAQTHDDANNIHQARYLPSQPYVRGAVSEEETSSIAV